MTRASLAFAILTIAGAILGRAAESSRTSAAMFLGGERILAGDFHVHPAPGDGALLPWDWAREARRRGLDVIAITGHNQMIGVRATSPLATPFGVLIVPGDEITAPSFHLAAVGLDHSVAWDQPLAAIVDAVHAQGGVAIAAHPAGEQRDAWTPDAFRLVDGLEVAHPMMFERPSDFRDLRDAWATARTAHPGIAPIGSTDAHAAPPIGLCRTFLLVREVSIAGVVDAIRRGRTVACDGQGRVTGDPELSAAVQEACQAAAVPLVTSVAERAGMLLMWLGLVGLSLLSFD